MNKLGIIGLGLMGGSLGLAVKRRRLARTVSGYSRSEESRRLALARGAVDSASDRPELAVAGADLVVFCLPVLMIPRMAEACRAHLPKGCLLTDVGSTKAGLVRSMRRALRGSGAAYVGSHPIAGSERTGMAAARSDLYDGAMVVVTPEDRTPRARTRKVAAFWEALGCRIVVMDAAGHDRMIARTSHLPHLVAAMLVDSVLRGGAPRAATFCGSGFRDATRIAGGSEEVWHDIVKSNRAAVLRELDAFRRVLDRVTATVQAGDFDSLRRFLAAARTRREACVSPGREEAQATVSSSDFQIVPPCAGVRGTLRVPGDKSLSHRVAMLSALAGGASRIEGVPAGEDCVNTLEALAALGAEIEIDGTTVRIKGTGGVFSPPEEPLYLGNSGTSMRLLAGLLAGQPFISEMTGDESLCSRPMGRIKAPLERMGARIELLGAKKDCAPVRIAGGRLRGIEYRLPVASAQVKSCVLLAGLFADGTTTVIEPAPTRDHTERVLAELGVPVTCEGGRISVTGSGGGPVSLPARKWVVPGDFSSAAFWMTAAAGREGSEVVIEGVGLNPRRTALLDVLARMGAEVEVREQRSEVRSQRSEVRSQGEPCGTVVVRGRKLRGTTVGGVEIPNLIDELPVVAVAGALAEGRTVIRDARELRVKESDRIAGMAECLTAFGVRVQPRPDGMTIQGGARIWGGGEIASHGDHRIAMAAAILALFADKPVRINGVACIATSYPAFWKDLEEVAGRHA